MNVRAPEAGTQVSRGHVRVDAARAIKKLREYQLPRSQDWILEALRAAAASGSTSIQVQGDTNDVWLWWLGAPWDALEDLLSELVSPESRGRERRLLARAVNSAIGIDTEYVDLYAATATTAKRLRFTRETLTETVVAEDVERASVPELSTGNSGMVLHVRRRLGLRVVGNLLRGQPLELLRARQAAWPHGAPIHVQGAPLLDRDAAFLVTVPLGSGLDGYIGVLRPEHAHPPGPPRVVFAEHGVVLAEELVEMAGSGTGPQFLVAHVNTGRLPANASRSQVRRDAHPVNTALAEFPHSLNVLCSSLVRLLRDNPQEPAHRRAAFGLISQHARGSTWHAGLWEVPTHLRELLELPLLRNANGLPRPLKSSWQGVVYRGSAPYPEEFSPWMADIPWIPDGDPAELLLGDSPGGKEDFQRIAKRARQGLSRRQSFHKRPRRVPKLPENSDFLLKCDLGAMCPGSTAEPFRHHLTSLKGQVALVRGPSRGRGARGQLHIYWEGRELERMEGPARIGFQAVVEGSDLTPDPGYRRVERNGAFQRLVSALNLQLVAATEALLLAQQGHLVDGYQVDSRAVVREDGQAWGRWALSLLGHAELRPADTSPLAGVPLYRDAEGRYHSIHDLQAHDVIAMAEHFGRYRPIHLCLVGTEEEAELLAQVVSPTDVAFYPPEAMGEAIAPTSALQKVIPPGEGIAVLQPEEPLSNFAPDVHGAIAWTHMTSRLHVHHANMSLVDTDFAPLLGPAHVVVQAEFLVPRFVSPETTPLQGLDEASYVSWEQALFRACARFLSAPEEARPMLARRLNLAVLGSVSAIAKRVLQGCEHVSIRDADGNLRDELVDAPILPTEEGWVSVREWQARCGTKGPYFVLDDPNKLRQARILGFSALALPGDSLACAGRLLEAPLEDGTKALEHALRAAERDSRRSRHLSKAPRTLDSLLAHAGWKEKPPHVSFEFSGATVHMYPAAHFEGVRMALLVEGRLFGEYSEESPFSLQCVIDARPDVLDEQYSAPRPTFIPSLMSRLAAGAEELVEAVCQDPRPLGSEAAIQKLIIDWITVSAYEGKAPSNIDERIRTQLRFRSLHGEPTSVEGATGQGVRIARPVGTWLFGAELSPFDAPIIAADGDAERLIRLVSNAEILDCTADVLALQARRRIEQGLVERPRVRHADADIRTPFEELGHSNLGIGEMALCVTEPHVLTIYREGKEVAYLSNWSRWPVSVAVENPAMAEAVAATSTGTSLERNWHSAVEARVRNFLTHQEAALRDYLLGDPDTKLLQALREAVFRGEELPGALAMIPLFEQLRGPMLSAGDVAGLSDGLIGIVGHRDVEAPDTLERPVLVVAEGLPESAALSLFDATELLRLAKVAEDNRKKAPARALEFPRVVQAVALGSKTIDLGSKREQGGQALVAVLESQEERGLEVLCEGLLLCRLPDPCPWPTLSVLQHPAIHPNERFDGVHNEDLLQKVTRDLRAASRALLRDAFPPPKDRLVSTFILAAYNEKGHVQEIASSDSRPPGMDLVSGRFWLSDTATPRAVQVGDSRGYERRSTSVESNGSPRPLPVQGTLALAGGNIPDAALDGLALIAYRRMIRRMGSRWSETSRDERHRSHVGRALVLGVVTPLEVEQAVLERNGAPCDPESYLLFHQNQPEKGVGEAAESDLEPPQPAPANEVPADVPASPASDEASDDVLAPLTGWLMRRLRKLQTTNRSLLVRSQPSGKNIVEQDGDTIWLSHSVPSFRLASERLAAGLAPDADHFDIFLHIVSVLRGTDSDVTEAAEEAAIAAAIAELVRNTATSPAQDV